ncbi:LamG-like jellyroll fold domain-containing protein [Haloflavibacter putidus]|uniref:T9SS type A sorting domain-containing protein n=1 Tax=Haloflavibacter putidus TaxID=2576776 RepID=A0A507ZEJ3_9FLAO|nr:LamG-like jellyroll fold domain-containing protein [Haloflavibacter putidus]TQD34338.1 T9SS type A sorting domain-containing protein [Haloflavibacter putidus]
MKKTTFLPILLLIFTSFSAHLSAQEGPGGVGTSANNPFWFAADQLASASNNTAINSWTNIGGSILNATQNTAGKRPVFLDSQVNALPAIAFGGNDYLEIGDSGLLNDGGPFSKRTFALAITTGGDINTRQVVYEEGGSIRGLNIYIDNGMLYFGGYNLQNSDGSDSPWGYVSASTSITTNTNYILVFRFDGNAAKTGTLSAFVNGVAIGSANNIGQLYNHNNAVIGAQVADSYYHDGNNSGSEKFHFTGLISEMAVYAKALNVSERITLENYLSSKYAVAISAGSDRNSYDTATEGDFDFHSVGIGRNDNLDSYLTSSIGTGIVAIQNNTLNDGNFLIIASNQLSNTNLSPAPVGCSSNATNLYRTESTWRVSKNGSFNNTTFRLDIDSFNYSNTPFDDVQLEVSSTSNFTTGSTTLFNVSSVNGSTITFDNVNVADGNYIKFLLPSATPISRELPAGLSTLSNTKFWWRAENSNLANNSNVANWENEGDDPNNANQTSTSRQPLFLENQFNTYPAIQFDGIDDNLEIPNNINLNVGGPFSQRSFSVAFETSLDVATTQVLYEEGGNQRNLHVFIENNNLYVGGYNIPNSDGAGDNWNNKQISAPIVPNERYVLTFTYNGTSATDGDFTMYLNGDTIGSVSGVGLLYAHSGNINIGGNPDSIILNGSSASNNYFDGKMAEFIIHDYALNSEEILLLQNYLASKYDINLTTAYINIFNTTAAGNFDHDLVAVIAGLELTNKTDSQFGTGIVRLSNPSNFSTGKYLFIVSNTKEYSKLNLNDLNCNATAEDNLKLNAIWRVGKIGNLGSLDLELALSSLNIPNNAYTDIELLIDDNENFTSPTVISSVTNACETVSFSNVNFSNGDYFTFRINNLQPITWDGSQFLYGTGSNGAPGIEDAQRKLVINNGLPALLENDASVKCVTIVNSAELTLDANVNLNLSDDLNNQGIFNASDGILSLSGDSAQQLTGNTMNVGNFIISNPAGANINLATQETFYVQKLVEVNQGGVLNTNDNLTLQCDFTGPVQEMAQIANLSNGTINGKVTTEQCFPARRAFRLLASPVTTSTSINTNWQEGVHNTGVQPTDNLNPNNGYGTHITGSINGNNGFDATPSGNPSLFRFDNSTQQWDAVNNTLTNSLQAAEPYLLMVRGSRAIDVTSNAATPTNTKIRATGTILSGDQTFNTGFSNVEGDFNAFGNPYPAAVDMLEVLNDPATTNAGRYFYIFDPTLGGTPTPGQPGGRGAYVAIDVDNLSTEILPNGTQGTTEANRFLQPMQAAFFVTGNQNVQPVIKFQEDYKNTDEAGSDVFRSNSAITDVTNKNIRLYLFTEEAFTNGASYSDRLKVNFSENYTNAVDFQDAPKLFNQDENLSRNETGNLLSIEKRQLPEVGEILPLQISQYRTNSYIIQINISNIEKEVYLEDNYLGTSTLLENAENTLSFTVDPSSSSSGALDRFSLRFGDDNLNTDTIEQRVLSYYPNPIQDNQLFIEVGTQSNTSYQITIYNVLGQQVLIQQPANQNGKLHVRNLDFPSGLYYLILKNKEEGIQETLKIIKP